MSITLLLIALIIALAIALILSYVVNQKTEDALIATRDRLMSLMIGKKLIVKRNYIRKEEIAYLTHLEAMFGDKFIIKPQVHLSDIADIKFGYYDHDNLYYDLKRIILDYVIFDRQYVPLVGIELNGSSHFFTNRLNRDKLTENLLQNIGVEYQEISLSKKFVASEVRNVLEKKIDLAKQGLVSPKGYSEKTG